MVKRESRGEPVEDLAQKGEVAPIECKRLWKIYGAREKEAFQATQKGGLSKEEVLKRFDCVIGVIDVSFRVKEGEIFCIMGLSGSGKSTLIRHVNRLIEPTAGKVLIRGIDIGTLNDYDLRELRMKKIGMVFQNMALMPHRTVRDNVGFALELRQIDKAVRRNRAQEALDLVQLSNWGDKYPDELSGGMQQRVGLARAIAADPDILLMDEPFSALDPLIRRQLQGEFLSLSSIMQKTTLFITHDLDEAIRMGDRIAIMKDGAFIQIGTPEEIVIQPADDYVADFVAGISRLKLVYARTVMRPVEAYCAVHSKETLEKCPEVAMDADLDCLIDIMVATDRPIKVVEKGETIGVFQLECLTGDTIVSNTTIKKFLISINPSLKKYYISLYIKNHEFIGKVEKHILSLFG